MQMVPPGHTGVKVSRACLGTMTFGIQADEPTAFAIMDRADEAGINFIDTADAYPLGAGLDLVGRTEEMVGAWLRERGARARMILATKCYNRMGPGPNDEGLSRRHIIAACEASLRRLQTDSIDLYQMHAYDATTPIDETLRALEEAGLHGSSEHDMARLEQIYASEVTTYTVLIPPADAASSAKQIHQSQLRRKKL
jgi:aryl-alcohol dehydrogenase-like predicted oxidoreductase